MIPEGINPLLKVRHLCFHFFTRKLFLLTTLFKRSNEGEKDKNEN